ncbi:MAG: iron-siderophore ABC transporter substrate-binding protein [Chloroflexota bacterium]
MITGCGAEEAAAPTATVATRTITDGLGREVVLPANPQRIAVLEPDNFLNVLALNAPIAAAPNLEGFGAFYEELFPEGATDIGSFGEPNLELLTTAAPDVIIVTPSRVEEILDQLEQIAPVVGIPIFEEDENQTWQKYFRPVAEALGRQEEAEEIITAYDERVAGIRAALGGAEAVAAMTFSFLRFRDPATFYITGIQHSIGQFLYNDLGFSLPAAISEADGFGRTVSLEEIELADADIIFGYSFGEEEHEVSQPVWDSPLWQRLNAVQNGRFYELGEYWWAISPQTVNRWLDDIEQYVVEDSNPPS